MTFGSVCSGIEAASVAWGPLGWRCAFVAEINPQASAVLAHHYPDVTNHGDFTAIGTDAGPVDVLVGGTPCQSFSVAGLRGGLADERGNLALEYLRLADRLRPRWVVWENVPGVLSSGRGRDFGAFLGGLAQLGYGFAYRVLDAQFFGLAQRRKRVFVVGHFGDWRRAAAVLLEREGILGNPSPRRQAESRVTPAVTPGARRASGNRAGELLTEVSPPLTTKPWSDRDSQHDRLVAHTLTSGTGARCPGNAWNSNYVTHTLKGEGHDGGEDGTGRGVPIIPVAYQCQGSNVGEMGTLRAGNGNETGGVPFVAGSSVRRLTPMECERLQGFLDGYTDVPWKRGRMPDSARYRMLGNSMAVPVMAWIGRRLTEATS